MSSLASGLLTIGPRFGGALNGAALQFSAAFDTNMSPQDFVNDMKKKNEYIMGIGKWKKPREINHFIQFHEKKICCNFIFIFQ